jgi:hypothetical protein
MRHTQSRWPVDLLVPSDRPVRPGHRRPPRTETGSGVSRRFFTQALEHGPCPTEVTTDRAPAYLRVLDEFLPAALACRRSVCE